MIFEIVMGLSLLSIILMGVFLYHQSVINKLRINVNTLDQEQMLIRRLIQIQSDQITKLAAQIHSDKITKIAAGKNDPVSQV